MVPAAFASVAVGRPVRGEFTYRVPDALVVKLQPGVRLKVPFGRGTALGFYLGPAAPPPAEVISKVRDIESVLDEAPAFTPDVVELVRFAASHYRHPLGEALRATLPPGLTKAIPEVPAELEMVTYAVALPAATDAVLTRAPAQHATLSYLLAVGGRASTEEIAHAIPGARAHLARLAERGFIRLDETEVIPGVREGLTHARPAALTDEQREVLATLEPALEAGGYAPFLLHGVTGSGKTEVYLQLAERALSSQRGALILVPEIALTPQVVGRFRSRFGQHVAVLHSALKDRERLDAWQRLRRGEVRLAVGVRSAVFAPVQSLGLIVVDEEHDPSFKQDDKLRYQARDLAVMRASQVKCLVVLGSATPSLETLENVRRNRYRLLSLTKRVDDRPMPTVELVDLRLARPRTPETRGTEAP
ncbi:MAG: primosomal protein N', partial [Archangium sp.]|nr:primosomal protein N' [Archangium sp.]